MSQNVLVPQINTVPDYFSKQFKQFKNELKLYDSLSTSKRLFQPIEMSKVGIYVCGMTVYDYCHIGHARVMVAFDIVVRWLRHLGYDVNYVRNITDIDDKIIARANENNEDISELTERFIKAMHEDAAALGCASPNLEPRATKHIDNMLSMIDTLEQSKHAYAADNGDVYYAVDSFSDYGKLSKRKLDSMQAGARVLVDNDKRNPLDFVLWKAAKADEPKWSSRWGGGRPGWHIECSAMSIKCLGNSFDIHGGGHDLQFPHHENEIAQSEAATGCTYANNWMHVGFINVDGEKMSKSLGNFFTIRDVQQKFHPETIRFFILTSHYRSQVNFSDAALTEAHAGLTRIYQALKAAEAVVDLNSVDEAKIDTAQVDQKSVLDFINAMNDDFNTAQAISILFYLSKCLNKAVQEYTAKLEAPESYSAVVTLALQLKALASVLNIGQLNPIEFLQNQVGETKDNQLSNEAIEKLITERQNAKNDKNYELADKIRMKLTEAGIELEDSSTGTTWRRG